MNIEKHLIFVKGEDKTEQIQYCEYTNGKWQVLYNNNTRAYSYNYLNVIWTKSLGTINHEACIVYDKDQPVSGIAKIIDFGEHVRLIFKTGYKKVYPKSSLLIEETSLDNKTAHRCFEYLKKLADNVSIKNEDDISFLSKQYSKITNISPRSVLSTFLERKPLKKQNSYMQPIFPFGFNLSQKTATEKAFTEQISVIEGPPGTGKTQTILNIIANAIINNKTVAIVSNNNSATANVFEKLQKYDVDFIAAFLGNNDNKGKFFAQQMDVYPNMNDWVLQSLDAQVIRANLMEAEKKLNEMLGFQNRLANLKQQFVTLQTEVKYFDKYYMEAMVAPLKLRSFF